jgi:hypothetical protein
MLTGVPEKKRNILQSRSCCIILPVAFRLKNRCSGVPLEDGRFPHGHGSGSSRFFTFFL